MSREDKAGQTEPESQTPEQKSEADRQLDEIVTRTFDELDADGKKYLEDKGYSEEFYDTLTPEARRKLWICMF